jgi:hypothetical protein
MTYSYDEQTISHIIESVQSVEPALKTFMRLYLNFDDAADCHDGNSPREREDLRAVAVELSDAAMTLREVLWPMIEAAAGIEADPA